MKLRLVLALPVLTLGMLIAAPASEPLQLAAPPIVAELGGCHSLTAQDVKNIAKRALDAAALFCIFQQHADILDEQILADLCNINKELLPELRDLIAHREAGKRAGVRWSAAAPDAGR